MKRRRFIEAVRAHDPAHSVLEEAAMTIGRRTFIHGSAAAAGAAMLPRELLAQGAPWAQRPAGNPQSLTFVVWQYGKIYEREALRIAGGALSTRRALREELARERSEEH